MAFMKRVALAPRAVRQLRRVRSVYLVGMMLSLLGLVLQLDREAGAGRQLGIAAILLAAFTALFGLAVVQLWRHTRTSHCSTSKKLTRAV
ncbi:MULTISPECIES: hypothetical protein [unclassified Streptomyces]|uniref:hypothetical protein n=1 Tax=unclassified Streptomyces TaxID=2593676 RepID=UPI00344C3FD0